MALIPEKKQLWFAAVFLLAALLLSVFSASYGEAKSIEELKRELETKNEEIKKLEDDAKKYRDEIAEKVKIGKTLQEELKRNDRVLGQLKREIGVVEKKIEKTKLEIETADFEIGEKKASLKRLKGGLAALVQSLSEKDRESMFAVLARYGFISDFLRQIDYLAFLERKILGQVEIVRKVKEELEVKKAEAEKFGEELEGLQAELTDRRFIQEGIRRERGELLKNTKNQEKRYQELLRGNEKKQEEILRAIEELEEELRKRVDPESLPPERKGFLFWPTEGLLSQGYGETPFTRSGRGRHFYRFHNGIDIAGSFGLPVFAADDGAVMAAGDTDKFCPKGAYGKYIVIDHKNNFATMYAHLSLIKVKSGEEVKKGDIIGYMGSSGLSTGPHLHFTLYDSRTVEIKPGKIGTCGPLPFGGSLNPLLYL